MNITISAEQGDRLDKLVYKTLGSLDNFTEILKLNIDLKNKIYLDAGDIVILPKLQTKIKIEDELW
jgi:hypothetical protein